MPAHTVSYHRRFLCEKILEPSDHKQHTFAIDRFTFTESATRTYNILTYAEMGFTKFTRSDAHGVIAMTYRNSSNPDLAIANPAANSESSSPAV